MFFLLMARFLNDTHHSIEKDMAFYLIYNILVYPPLLQNDKAKKEIVVFRYRRIRVG